MGADEVNQVTGNLIRLGALFLIAAAIGWSFWRAHKDPNFDFNVFDLWMEGGRLSKISVIVNCAFIVATWIMVDLQLKNKMTEAYLTWYGGVFVAPLIARLIFVKGEGTKDETK